MENQNFYPKETKSLSQKGICTTAVLFTIVRTWKESKCPVTDKWIYKCGIHIQRNIIQPRKGGNSTICDKVDEP